MGVLKVLGTVICSVLLFLALSVFSVAFLLNSTVLNPDFMNSQIDKLDISSIADDMIREEITGQLPRDAEFLQGVVIEVVDMEEPVLKKELHKGIDNAYAYLLDEQEVFAFTISFVEIKQNISDVIWEAAVDYLNARLAGLPEAEVDRYVEKIARQIPDDVMPMAIAVLPEGLRIEVIKQYLKELGGRGLFESASFGLDFLVEAQVKDAVEQYFEEAVAEIPDSYTVDENTIEPETMDSLRTVKTVIITFKFWFVWLIVFMIVLAGLIFLINWSNIRGSMRSLGIDLLIFGIIDLALVLVARFVGIPAQNPLFAEVPASMQDWVKGLYMDVVGIMMWFSIGVIIVGIVLTAASFFIKPREAEA